MGLGTCPAMPTEASSLKDFTRDYVEESRELVSRGRGETIIMFDWDDTLCPTWFITEVLAPCDPAAAIQGGLPLAQDSPFYEALSLHAKAVEATLRLAASLGHVCIVTLAQRSWLMESAARFLPGLNLAKLLKDLHVRVFYARDYVHSHDVAAAEEQEGVNPWAVAKGHAMRRALRQFTRKGVRWTNVLSIGDSAAEHAAITDLLWWHGEEIGATLCKSLKLMDDPSVRQLGDQLSLLLRWLPAMASHDGDFHLSFNECSNISM